MIVQVRNAYKSFGSQELFKDLNLIIQEHEKVALIGANGVGKTTLFNVLAQEMDLDSGDVFWASGVRKGFLDQIHVDNNEVILKDFFDEVFVDLFAMQKQLESYEQKMIEDHSEKTLMAYDRIQNQFLRRGGYTYETEIHTFLTKFGFEVADLSRPLSTFSGGQITRLAFVRLLLSKPDVLFLDEPTNHLDIATIEWLEGYLSQYDGAVVIVSHDRLFLDRVCRVIVEIENHEATRYESNYSGYLQIKEKDIERHNIKYQNQQREIERIEKLIEKFRYKKSKAAFAQSKIKYLDRMDKLEKIDVKKREFKADFKSRLRGGKDVLTVDKLAVGYDKPLLELSTTFTRGKRYAIFGENGCGKSTLLKTLAGRLPALSGDMLLGHQIEMGYFDQQLLDFSMEKTVLEEVWDDFPQLDHTEVRQALGRFLFYGEEVFKPIHVLSGGERVRLTLVKLMLKQDNLLILDEPTNHLDIQGKEALEKALADFDGTMIFVSHDRYFIDKLATDTFVIQNGEITHTEKTVQEIISDEKESVAEVKETNKQTFQELKRIKNRQKVIERDLERLGEELELHRESRFDPDFYHDHEKMDELNGVIDTIHNEIKHLEEEWTENALILEQD